MYVWAIPVGASESNGNDKWPFFALFVFKFSLLAAFCP